MSKSNLEKIKALLINFEKKNIQEALSFFTDEAIFIDSHYPRSYMKGKDEISDGLLWGFSRLKKLGFSINEIYECNKNKMIIAVDTFHILPNGKPLEFPQLFMIEFHNGKIQSFESYTQYPPDGMVGLMLKVTRIMRNFRT